MSETYNKERIFKLLNDKGIPYECMEHQPVLTMEEMERIGITQKGTVCKNLFLRDAKGRNHYLITLPDEKRIDLKELASKIGSAKLSFASKERLEKYLGVEQGCVSPLGVLNDGTSSVHLVFDSALAEETSVGIHPNDNTATLWLSFENLRELIELSGNPYIIIDL